MFTPRLGIFLSRLRSGRNSIRNYSPPSSTPSSASSSTTTATATNTSTEKEELISSKTKDEISAELLESEHNLKRLKESYLTSLAEQENVRTRSKRDVDAASQYAIQKFAKDIINVGDILEMALKTEEEIILSKPECNETIISDLHKGLQMTLEELRKVFIRHGLTSTDPLHQKFDPNLHMALFEVESEEHEVGTIISVLKRGYSLNSRLIRPAQVSVSKKKGK